MKCSLSSISSGSHPRRECLKLTTNRKVTPNSCIWNRIFRLRWRLKESCRDRRAFTSDEDMGRDAPLTRVWTRRQLYSFPCFFCFSWPILRGSRIDGHFDICHLAEDYEINSYRWSSHFNHHPSVADCVEQLVPSDMPDSDGIPTGVGDHIKLAMVFQDPVLGTFEQAPASDDDQIAMRYALMIWRRWHWIHNFIIGNILNQVSYPLLVPSSLLGKTRSHLSVHILRWMSREVISYRSFYELFSS